jgi:hypothetical protein
MTDEMAGPKWYAVLVFVLVAVPARAQVPPHRLIVDPSVVGPASERRQAELLKPASDPPPRTFDVRPFIESVTGALSATPHLRAADAAVGGALIAFGTRRHHPMSSAVFLGVHTLQLAVGKKVPAGLRGFDIQPDVGRGRIAITVRRTVGAR